MNSKKGVFFTFIALFIIILIVAVISTNEKYRYREKSESIYTRVRTMNTFIDDFEKDLDREMYIGGYRALLSMNSYIRQIEDYVSDFDTIFSEILINGSANGTQIDFMFQNETGYQKGADLKSWLQRINEKASQMNIEVTVDITNISMIQRSPWSVVLIFNLTAYIIDMKGLATWKIDRVYEKEFSILGFEDPMYIVETKDKVTNIINITPDTDFIDDATMQTDVLEAHIANSYYINNNNAPSYLMRFTGNMSPSPYGIESLVNLDYLDVQGIQPFRRSIVDYIYFSDIITADYCNVTGTDLPSWFRIDDTSAILYEADKLSMTNCTI